MRSARSVAAAVRDLCAGVCVCIKETQQSAVHSTLDTTSRPLVSSQQLHLYAAVEQQVSNLTFIYLFNDCVEHINSVYSVNNAGQKTQTRQQGAAVSGWLADTDDVSGACHAR